VFYALDRLWKDCPTVAFVDAAAPADESTGAAGNDVAEPEVDSDDETLSEPVDVVTT
jgi:ribosome-associated protein